MFESSTVKQKVNILIDLREIKNIKLANRLLKIRRKKKKQEDQRIQQENIKAQSEANINAQKCSCNDGS